MFYEMWGFATSSPAQRLRRLAELEQRSGRTKTADTAMVHGPLARIKLKITHLSDAPTSHWG
jgi:hypothetical protein